MSLPSQRSSIAHYDEIPDYCMGYKILDVGSSNGYGAINSRYRDWFYFQSYLGIDIQRFEETFLPIIKGDIFQYETEVRYDTILLLHVLEHMSLDQWGDLLSKLDSLLAPNGYLVVNVPFAERENSGSKKYMIHQVLNIDEVLLSQYWDFQKYLYVGKPKIVVFRDPGENFVRSCVRFVIRILTHHKHSVIRRYLQLKPPRIVAIYQKKGDEE